MHERREIDFLGIGAHGAGSAWLWRWLSRHPDVGFLKPGAGDGDHEKEVHYWNRHRDKTVDWYLEHFDWNKRVVGEITPAYSRLTARIVRGIEAVFPRVQVMYLVRNPLYRTWAEVRRRASKLRFGRDRLKLKWAIEQATRPKVAVRNDYVTTAENWRPAFGNGQFHVFPYDLITERPGQLMCRICEILDLDPAIYEQMNDDVFDDKREGCAEADCPPEFATWFETQPVMAWEEQLRHLENMGVLDTLGESIDFGGSVAAAADQPIET